LIQRLQEELGSTEIDLSRKYFAAFKYAWNSDKSNYAKWKDSKSFSYVECDQFINLLTRHKEGQEYGHPLEQALKLFLKTKEKLKNASKPTHQKKRNRPYIYEF
jgi:hypothetical protein